MAGCLKTHTSSLDAASHFLTQHRSQARGPCVLPVCGDVGGGILSLTRNSVWRSAFGDLSVFLIVQTIAEICNAKISLIRFEQLHEKGITLLVCGMRLADAALKTAHFDSRTSRSTTPSKVISQISGECKQLSKNK